MKKQKNHFQSKDQENSPEIRNNETDLFSLIDIYFKKEDNANTEGIKTGC